MAYLLDTHVLLWALDQENRLSRSAHEIISNIHSACFVSIISLYEIVVKRKIGKLELGKSLSEYIEEVERIGLVILPITIEHLENYENIPLHDDHRDPFDRLIIATAYHEQLVIISADNKFDRYKNLVEIMW